MRSIPLKRKSARALFPEAIEEPKSINFNINEME